MLVWTAALIFGLAVFAQAHLRMGGFVTALWMLTLLGIGFRMGSVGDRETLREVNVAGLSLIMLGMMSIALAGKLLLRRIQMGAATLHLRQMADQLSGVTLAVLTRNDHERQTGAWPAAAQALSWVWATMMFFSFLFLMYLHLVSGPKGWLFLFLAVVVLGAAFWAGRNWFVGKSDSLKGSTTPTSTGGGASGEGDYRV